MRIPYCLSCCSYRVGYSTREHDATLIPRDRGHAQIHFRRNLFTRDLAKFGLLAGFGVGAFFGTQTTIRFIEAMGKGTVSSSDKLYVDVSVACFFLTINIVPMAMIGYLLGWFVGFFAQCVQGPPIHVYKGEVAVNV